MTSYYALNDEAYARLTNSERFAMLINEYRSNTPFPHVVLDGILDPYAVSRASETFPTNEIPWWQYDNIFEKKYAWNQLRDLSVPIRGLINELQENKFVSFLETLTGIEGLIVDHTLNGGGIHKIRPGGKLDVHVDYNYHPITRLDRRLNVLLYLNENWEEAWGGNLELWSKDMTHCVKSISPVFNRMVIFSTTDESWHGHPEPLACPLDRSRKSIALYYYTNGRPVCERSDPHSTIFKRRPQDPINPEHELLRAKRAEKRL